MKVTGPAGTASSIPGRPTQRAAGGFSLSGAAGSERAAAAGATAATGAVADVSALMALQGVEDPTERRRRAMRRGGGLLDRLDELKLAMLGGEADQAALERLARAVREERPSDPDAGLTAVLDQIDLRAAVELAKAEIRRASA